MSVDDIKVSVLKCGDRPHWQMQFRDPLTGKLQRRSTGVKYLGGQRDRTAAERAAAKWENELREGKYAGPRKTSWATFRERYEEEKVTGMAKWSDRKISSIFNTVEKLVSPRKLADLTASRISTYQAELRKLGRTETTIKSHSAHLKAALRWAKAKGLLAVVPEIEMPKRAKLGKAMKGRPVTGEEFDRMLAAVPKVVLDQPADPEKPDPEREAHNNLVVASWRYYLEGLYLSGLRLSESLELYWDRTDKLCIEMTGGEPMLYIPAHLEKGNRDRVLPITPDFAEFLLKTPAAERTGRVFNPLAQRVRGEYLQSHRVGEIVSAIGAKAGVKVKTDPKTGKAKFASAHDLRRSFGQRWAPLVSSTTLQFLMRHDDIQTTLRYYVDLDARTVAKSLRSVWGQRAAGNISDNSAENQPAGNRADSSQV